MCGLRTRLWTDVDPPRFWNPWTDADGLIGGETICHRRTAIGGGISSRRPPVGSLVYFSSQDIVKKSLCQPVKQAVRNVKAQWHKYSASRPQTVKQCSPRTNCTELNWTRVLDKFWTHVFQWKYSRWTSLEFTNCIARTAALQPINFVTLTRATNNASGNWVNLVQVRSVLFNSAAVNSSIGKRVFRTLFQFDTITITTAL